MRQSNATSGSATRGEPVGAVSHSVHANLSAPGGSPRPAKESEIAHWSSRRTFTQNTRFRAIAEAAGLRWWTQTSRIGRSPSAETDDIAETVTPARPPAPSVVTTFTVLAVQLIAPPAR